MATPSPFTWPLGALEVPWGVVRHRAPDQVRLLTACQSGLDIAGAVPTANPEESEGLVAIWLMKSVTSMQSEQKLSVWLG